MFGRPAFGVSQPNTFGFGSGTSTSFGQPNQLFGSTNTTFGSGSSGFGTASQPIFGASQQNTAPLFGTTATPAFGQSNQSSGFELADSGIDDEVDLPRPKIETRGERASRPRARGGRRNRAAGTSLFGNSQQPSSSGGIFGTPSSSSFGQQPKTAGFGFPSSSSGGLFGQNTQSQQNASSMFQASTSNTLFGSSSSFGGAQAQTGTVNKFVPVTGTDSVQKSGVVQSINTKHHCITCMKEYENKSLEELRWEDYQANRKGPQQAPTFGAPSQPFGITSSSNLFGQAENKPAFGQSPGTFGQPNFGITSQATPSNMFGKPSTGFGNTSTTNSFAFGAGTSTAGPFGSSIASKPFTAPTNQSLFGPTQPQQNSFGGNAFGQSTTQPTSSSNLFTKPAQQQGFNMGQSSFQFGPTQQNPTNVFQPQKGITIFGQPNTTTTTFGQQQQQSTFTPFNNFAKPPQATFGQPSQSIFGTGINSNSIFGNNANKNLFTPTTNLFGNTFQPNTGFSMPSQQQHHQPILNMQAGLDPVPQDSRPFLQLADPYGYHPHLDGLSPVKQQPIVYTTNPKELQKYLEVPQPIAIVSPTQKRLRVFPPIAKKKGNLFDDDIDSRTSEINFSLKRSAKRLIICKENTEDNSTASVDIDGASCLKRSTGQSKDDTATVSVPPAYKNIRRENIENSIGDDSALGLSTKYEKPLMIDKESQVDGLPSKSDKSDGSLGTPEDTCGIILKRPEYYTIPPLEKLHEHKQPDGQCLVKGFTIGRIGYGNVSFPDLMDVSNLNLDDLVHFRYRELTIYPDESKRPPLGKGLNRRAQVTLDRVYPKGKADRKTITDVKLLIAINFSESLRNLCDKHGTRFLDYRPETGSWVFMVEHFSKYTFSESDEEETLVQQPGTELHKGDIQPQQSEQASPEFQILFKRKKPNKTESESLIEQTIEEVADEGDDADNLMQTDTSMTEITESMEAMSSIGLEDYYPSVTSIESSTDLHHVQSRRSLYQKQGQRMLLMKATFFKEEDDVPVSIESVETQKKPSGLFKDLAKTTKPVQTRIEKVDQQRPHIFTLINKSCTVPLNVSYYNYRNYVDVGLFKGRTFRVGWSRGLTLVACHNALRNTEVNRNTRIKKVEIIDVSNLTGYDPLLESLPTHLHMIMESSQVSLIDGVPFMRINPGKGNLTRHQHQARQAYMKNYNNRYMGYFSEVWDLIVALWDDMPDDETRRERLSDWFKSSLERVTMIAVNSFDRNQDDIFFDIIFALLTGYQIRNASDVAIRNGLPNLAMLITQRNAEAKALLQYQIEQWRVCTALDYIDVIAQKIYMLLSGILVYQYNSHRSTKLVNAFDNLCWKHCLAMILWYMLPSTDTITTAICLYQQAFGSTHIAQRPTSEHLPEASNSTILDLQYHLLLLHCKMSISLEDILNPLTHTSYAADYRLSWIFLQILTALNVGRISEPAKNIITTSFSSQLESFGLTKWAVFVLLFIEDSSVRKNLVFRCLHRNLAIDSSKQVEFELVRDLHIPPEWIHEVKSYRSQMLGKHWHSYKHLAYTNMWYESHKIVMESIVPDLIINEKFDIIRKILDQFQAVRKRISTWKYQGGALLDFLKIMDIFNAHNKDFNPEEALDIHDVLLRVCYRFEQYPKKTPKQISALSELSKRCCIYMGILLEYIEPSHEGVIAATYLQVKRLVMPPDYRLGVIRCEKLFD